MTSRSARLTSDVLKDAKHVLLRGLPKTVTSRDVRRAVRQTGVKGVAEVDLQYIHFRPTGKAILTMSLPDYTHDAIVHCKRIAISGSKVEAEPIQNPDNFINSEKHSTPGRDSYLEAIGDGPSAGVVVRSTVSLSGLNGKTPTDAVQRLCEGYRLAKLKNIAPIQRVPLPEKKFSMFSRFCIHLESESEAQRLVRGLHMTPYKNVDGAPIIKAEVIY